MNSRKKRVRRVTPTALQLVRKRFGELADQQMDGLPPSWGPMSIRQASRRVLDRRVPLAEVDAVWAELVTRARTRQEVPVLVCAGFALPMLSTLSSTLTGHWTHRHDTQAMVLTALLEAVDWIDLSRPYVASRLRWAVYHRCRAAIRERRLASVPSWWVTSPDSIDEDADIPVSIDLGHARRGHPDELLELAVAEGVLTAAEARLIADTRLDGQPLHGVAADVGIDYDTVVKRRRRAELRLAQWLTHRLQESLSAGFSEVEAAAVDNLTRAVGQAPRKKLWRAMSENGDAAGVSPVRAPSQALADPQPARQEVRRCA
ncbi:hypothetical protein [Nocardia terpenica]|uniref:Uncharacterized protein n=1 Tax=Nocardia terpenica TaxID=455432 RepID=A0A164IUB0_9NOCA|nr:hypothetical protein [Nocardia terpenica]KZM69754.1 hypothetical protein AWN90_06940 [Nocardia terpenica]KZM74586.1 hypothetical protein AWN90_21120 [Nocardia terpenica]NQE89469.1 hypothetical protein [Nocardia terpenica]NQE93833.1 hypothetical protein [Nocardia terpenica]